MEFGKNERLSGDDPSGRDLPPPLLANPMTAQVAILDLRFNNIGPINPGEFVVELLDWFGQVQCSIGGLES